MQRIKFIGKDTQQELTMEKLKKGELAVITDPSSLNKGKVVVRSVNGAQIIGSTDFYSDDMHYLVRYLEPGERLEVC